MAFTNKELKQLKSVVDASIAAHPRFDQLEAKITADTAVKIDAAVDTLTDIIKGSLDMIDDRFNQLEHRIDNLRIVPG